MKRISVFATRAELLTREVLPGLAPYVRPLTTPLGTLGSAAVAALLCGLFLHPQGFVVFFGLVVVMALGVSWPWVSLWGLSGRLTFDRSRCREGEPVTARLILRNRMPWGVWGVSIKGGFAQPGQDGGDGSLTGLDTIPGGRTIERFIEFVPNCRGEYPLGQPRLACGFPFGLREASRPIEVAATLLVWPRTVPVGPVPEAQGHQSSDGLAARDRAGQWGDPMGVRPYRRGDPIRRVHWALSARHGELIVRELQSNATPRVRIVLDSRESVHTGSEPDSSLEWAIRVAASLAEGWIGQGAAVELVLEDCAIVPRGGSPGARSRAVLDALARLRPRRRSRARVTARRCRPVGRSRRPGRDHDRYRPAPARRHAGRREVDRARRPIVRGGGAGPDGRRDAGRSLDPDRRTRTRRDVSSACREGGSDWRLTDRKTSGCAGRPWRWRASPPWRSSRRCSSRAGPARPPWRGRSGCSSSRPWPPHGGQDGEGRPGPGPGGGGARTRPRWSRSCSSSRCPSRARLPGWS